MVLLCGLLLAACGKKGDLTLPPAAAKEERAAASAAD